MNQMQKDQINQMRAEGATFKAIANSLGLSENTVKSFYHRQTSRAKKLADRCAQCKAALRHTPGARKRKYCSDKCRMAWWAAHPEALNRKATYQFVCLTCGNSFESYGNVNRKYCSRTCFALRKPEP